MPTVPRTPRLRAMVLAGVLAGTVGLGGVAAVLADGGSTAIAGVAGPGAADIEFAQLMSAHHAQAIVMTDIVAVNPDLAIASLAHSIRTVQLTEIGRLQGFLSLWSAPELPADHHRAAMPGMATEAELQRLRAAAGERQADLFLVLMRRHHAAGIAMAQAAARDAMVPQVRSLAAKIAFDQQQETSLMTQLLSRRVRP